MPPAALPATAGPLSAGAGPVRPPAPVAPSSVPGAAPTRTPLDLAALTVRHVTSGHAPWSTIVDRDPATREFVADLCGMLDPNAAVSTRTIAQTLRLLHATEATDAITRYLSNAPDPLERYPLIELLAEWRQAGAVDIDFTAFTHLLLAERAPLRFDPDVVLARARTIHHLLRLRWSATERSSLESHLHTGIHRVHQYASAPLAIPILREFALAMDLADLLADRGDRDGSLALLHRCAAWVTDPHEKMSLAERLHERGARLEARELCEEILRIVPSGHRDEEAQLRAIRCLGVMGERDRIAPLGRSVAGREITYVCAVAEACHMVGKPIDTCVAALLAYIRSSVEHFSSTAYAAIDTLEHF